MEESFRNLLEDTIASQQTEGARLTIMNGPEDGRVHMLSKEVTIIGRAESADVPVLLDVSVSRRHALVTKEGPDYVLEDKGSRYGTQLDGQRLAVRQKLRDGSVVRVGETDLCFRVGDSRGQA